jgi:hypothetical protein
VAWLFPPTFLYVTLVILLVPVFVRVEVGSIGCNTMWEDELGSGVSDKGDNYHTSIPMVSFGRLCVAITRCHTTPYGGEKNGL